MTSPYYTPSGNPPTRGSGLSAAMRAEFSAIAAGFALLPQTLTANNLVAINSGGTGMTTVSSASFVTLTGSQTLTNKTLTSPVINTPAITGGTYSGGTFTSPTLVTPALGTPASGVATNLTGTAASLTAGAATVLATARAIYGNNFDGSAALTQIIASTYGGTGNGFTKFTGASSAEKTYTLPNQNDTILCAGTSSTVTKGYLFTLYDAGTKSSGTFTPDASNGNYQIYTNNGAHTLAAPTSDCCISLHVTNGASAGTVTFSGFTVGSNTGDSLTTTNASKFRIRIERINSVATYSIQALQ